MKQPLPVTLLALALADYAHTHAMPSSSHRSNGKLAWDATRVVALAAQVRRLVECGCNAELSSRQAKRRDTLRAQANDILRLYGMRLDNPWGLCHYACPIEADDRVSEAKCVFLA